VSVAGASAVRAASAVSHAGEVRLGEPFRVTIELRHDPEQRYDLAGTQDPGPFAILDGACASRPAALDGLTECAVELALLDLGTHAPVLRLEALRPPGAGLPVDVTATPVTTSGVTDPGVPAESIALRGPPEPVPLYVPTWEPVAWIALGVAVALSVAVAVVRRLVARARLAELRAREAPPPLTPSEAFEARLRSLESEPRPAGGAAPFYALSDALRAYLAALSPLATLDRTTTEVLAALRVAPIGGLDLQQLGAVAAQLDRAKYAGEAPDPALWRAALAAARAVLESTRPPRWDPDEEARHA
jgi:hypothetical protein